MNTIVDFVQSLDFKKINGYEIRLGVRDKSLLRLASDLLHSIEEYVDKNGRPLRPEETLGWASSVLKFKLIDTLLDGYEVTLNGDSFIQGVDNTLRRWKSQGDKCRTYKSRYDPPPLIDYAIASPDILEGSAFIAERYPYKEPNSGWWFYGEQYSGDLAKMQRVHLGHLVAVAPRVADYLALEPGFIVDVRSKESVRFDDSIAHQEPI